METIENVLYIIGNAPVGLIACDRGGLITIINPQAIELLSFSESPEELTGTNLIEKISGLPDLKEPIHNMINGTTQPPFIHSLNFGSKQLITRGKAIRDGYVISIHNIAQIIDAEKDTMTAVIQGQEQERKRIAKEIHDGINPMLAAIRLNLEAIMTRIMPLLDTQTIGEWNELLDGLDESIKELRAISHALLPGVIADYGLVIAIQSLCARLDGTVGLKANFITNLEERLPPLYESSIYRIVQELISNAIKHSGADTVNVQLLNHSESLILIVEDNGKGWDMADSSILKTGIGLRNIKGRVKAMAGTLVLDTQPGKGLCAIIELPFNHNQNGTH
jgi:signal transduction histidine kinase